MSEDSRASGDLLRNVVLVGIFIMLAASLASELVEPEPVAQREYVHVFVDPVPYDEDGSPAYAVGFIYSTDTIPPDPVPADVIVSYWVPPHTRFIINARDGKPSGTLTIGESRPQAAQDSVDLRTGVEGE